MALTMLVEFGSTGRSDAVPRQNESAGVTLQLVPPLRGENGMHPAVISPSPTRATTAAAPARARVLMATHRRQRAAPLTRVRGRFRCDVHRKRPRNLWLGVRAWPGRDYLSSTVAPASSSCGLGLLGVFLRHLLEHGLGGAVDQVLGVLEAQVREGANLLDDLDLLVAGGGEDDVELVLLVLGGSVAAAPTGGAAAATATGAAAVTPNFSSKSLSSSLSSSTVMLGDAVEDLFLGGHDQLSSVGVSAAAATVSVRSAASAARPVSSAEPPRLGCVVGGGLGGPGCLVGASGAGSLGGSGGLGDSGAGSAALASMSALQPVGEVAGQRLEQAGELLTIGAAMAPARRASSSSRGATSASALASSAPRHLVAEHAALDHQVAGWCGRSRAGPWPP